LYTAVRYQSLAPGRKSSREWYKQREREWRREDEGD